jgi:hypothetical protein
MKRTSLAALTFLAVACGSGGGSGSTVIQPQYQPQIVNVADSFSLQLTGVADGTGSLVYGWSNSGTRASINRSCAITGGNVILTVKDNGGAIVYANTLVGMSGSVSTGTGAAGTWTIQTDFTHATGTINFSAQKL